MKFRRESLNHSKYCRIHQASFFYFDLKNEVKDRSRVDHDFENDQFIVMKFENDKNKKMFDRFFANHSCLHDNNHVD